MRECPPDAMDEEGYPALYYALAFRPEPNPKFLTLFLEYGVPLHSPIAGTYFNAGVPYGEWKERLPKVLSENGQSSDWQLRIHFPHLYGFKEVAKTHQKLFHLSVDIIKQNLGFKMISAIRKLQAPEPWVKIPSLEHICAPHQQLQKIYQEISLIVKQSEEANNAITKSLLTNQSGYISMESACFPILNDFLKEDASEEQINIHLNKNKNKKLGEWLEKINDGRKEINRTVIERKKYFSTLGSALKETLPPENFSHEKKKLEQAKEGKRRLKNILFEKTIPLMPDEL